MKQGYSNLQEFAKEIERRRDAKTDLVVNTKNVSIVPAVLGDGLKIDFDGKHQFGINRIGHAQLAEVTGIPKQYYDKMLAEEPPLVAENVNTWFKHNETPQLFRMLDGKLRAVRSDKFRPDLEYEDMAEAFLPVFKELDLVPMSYNITDTRMYVKVVNANVERELQAAGGRFGEGHNIVTLRKISPAVTISNSEVGYGSARADVGLFDKFCSNLAIFGEHSFRKYHVGARHELGEDVVKILTDDTKRKTAVATVAQIRDIIRSAFSGELFNELGNKVAATQADKIEGDVVKVVTLTAKKLGLNEGEGQSVLKHLIEGGDLSRFGVYNAITRASQDVEDYDRATELERIGGNVITLDRSEWSKLAEAA